MSRWRRVARASLGLVAMALPAMAFRPAEPAPSTLVVFAAASLTEAFRELGRIVEQRQPGLTIRFNFAGSQQLATQIEQGAPADVFASADQRWMDYLKEKELLEDDAAVFARNRLVVIVPAANPAHIAALPDLARPGTKIVLAADAVPVGRYSREMLQALAGAEGFPAGYDRRVLANVVSQEENTKSVVSKVQLGEADAGIVYRSDVTPAVARSVRVLEVPERYNVIAAYPIAVLRSAHNVGQARLFVAVVRSGEGQQVLRRHGLLPVGSAAAEPASHP